ncbi:MAG TPA: glutamine synthetase family protein [Chthonomonadaceae bacterium]|nr:glutamine synthetase family protein [Chthonomonadaceae bacterium]
MNAEQILTTCQEAGVRLARFLYCDNGGVIRGKTSGMASLSSRLHDGIGLTVAMMAMNSLDQLQPIEGMGPVGEVRLMPDLDSFAVLPYTPHSAAFCCDMVRTDHAPWDACPRSFLKRMRERAAAQGLRLLAAFEAEFSLAQRLPDGSFTPFDQTLCFSSIAMTQAAAFVDDLVAALEAQGLTVEQYYPELAHGQHEISIRHGEALQAADHHVQLRETIRGVAWNHGLYASLAPKPWPDAAGNGGHIHFSLWDEAGQNVFYDPATPDSLSERGRHFLAGVREHLPALVALTCPSVNSYRRLQPQSWSSAFAVYGHDNREAAIRIASPFWSDRAGTVNLELKAADSSSNPYLALGGLLAAGLDGLDRRLDPGTAIEVDPVSLTEEQRREQGIARLPGSLDEALSALEADSVLMSALSPLLSHSYLTVRRSEAAAFRDKDTDFEIANHFYKF